MEVLRNGLGTPPGQAVPGHVWPTCVPVPRPSKPASLDGEEPPCQRAKQHNANSDTRVVESFAGDRVGSGKDKDGLQAVTHSNKQLDCKAISSTRLAKCKTSATIARVASLDAAAVHPSKTFPGELRARFALAQSQQSSASLQQMLLDLTVLLGKQYMSQQQCQQSCHQCAAASITVLESPTPLSLIHP